MLYQILRRLIDKGQTSGMEEKLDVFFAADKITAEQYQELIGMLPTEESKDEVH